MGSGYANHGVCCVHKGNLLSSVEFNIFIGTCALLFYKPSHSNMLQIGTDVQLCDKMHEIISVLHIQSDNREVSDTHTLILN